MTNVLPIALKNKRTLLIGAGEVAAQKYRVLLDSNFEVVVVAREIKDEIFKSAGVVLSDLKSGFLELTHPKPCDPPEGLLPLTLLSPDSSPHPLTPPTGLETHTPLVKIESCPQPDSIESSQFLKLHPKPCTHPSKVETCDPPPNNFTDFDLIVDASGDLELSEYLFASRKRYGFLLNVVDVPRLCDFYFGAIARAGSVAVMVSTDGASPILAQTLRDKIARILPRTLGNFSTFLKKQRLKITALKTPDSRIQDFKRPDSQKLQILNPKERESIKTACNENLGKVFIIGCGPGDFSSLTLKAYETLQLIDVALIDNLVSPKIWEFLESMGVECISVGKQKGGYGDSVNGKNRKIVKSYKQDSINNLMASLARQGKCVGRLKGGDPVIFGRVGEECSFLKARNIDVECVSGLSSSLCGALSSGILPTLRGVSSGVLIVSAHLRESVFHTQWLHWLKDSPYTLIVMMAYSFANRIVDEARARDIDLGIPAAFISKVDTAEQKSVIGTLGDLVEMANVCEKPAILIIGRAVEKSLDMPYTGERILMGCAEGVVDFVERVV